MFFIIIIIIINLRVKLISHWIMLAVFINLGS